VTDHPTGDPVQTPERPLSTADLAGTGRAEREERDTPATDERSSPLFPGDQAEGLRQRWQDVQAGFVDEPRRAVEQADELVAGAMKTLAESFAEERARLEHQWDRGEDVSTEDLRVALQRYREFFSRLLAI